MTGKVMKMHLTIVVCVSCLTQTEIIAFVFMSDSKWAKNCFKKFL